MKSKVLTTVKNAKRGGSRKGGCRKLAAVPPADPAQGQPRLLSLGEVSARLLMKPRTAARWVRQGRLPAYRLGHKLGFKWEEVEWALAAKHRVVEPGAAPLGSGPGRENLTSGNNKPPTNKRTL